MRLSERDHAAVADLQRTAATRSELRRVFITVMLTLKFASLKKL